MITDALTSFDTRQLQIYSITFRWISTNMSWAITAAQPDAALRLVMHECTRRRKFSTKYTAECASDLKMCMGRIYCQKFIICFMVQVHNFPI